MLFTKGENNGLGHVGMGVRDKESVAELKARADKEGLAPKPFSAELFTPGCVLA